MTVGSRSRWYKSISEREQNVPDLRVVEPVNDLFTGAVQNRNYRLLRKSLRYDDNGAQE